MRIPAVSLGKPDKTEAFDIYHISGIDVYTSRDIEPHRSGIRVFYKHYLWMKSLDVEGIYLGY